MLFRFFVARLGLYLAISLAAYPLLAAASVSTQIAVGNYRSNGNSVTPIDYVHPVLPVRATIQFSATPACFGLACLTGGPAVGAYSQFTTGDELDVQLKYSFSIVGPAPATVPLFISGIYSNLNPMVAGGSSNSVAGVSISQPNAGFTFISNCYNFDPQFSELPPAKNCGTGNYRFGFNASSVSPVTAKIQANIARINYDISPSSQVSVFIDPYIQIDPVWLGTHPGYTLAFDAGVANAPSLPIPEPGTAALLIAGTAMLGTRHVVRYRRGSARRVSA